MKVGVFAALDRQGGGTYQYSLSVLNALDQLRGDFETVIVHDRAMREGLEPWTSSGWQAIEFGPPTPRTIARRVMVQAVGESVTARTVASVRRALGTASHGRRSPRPDTGIGSDSMRRAGAWLRERGIELMLYPAPLRHSFESGIPYVMAIHDLQHRLHPEFPEVSADGEWEAREYLFANGVRCAEAIVVDSEVGRQDVLQFYGHLTSPDRIRVLPYVLPPYLATPTDEDVASTLRRLGIADRYLVFPAQFWPHKNHRRVTEAIARLCSQGLDVTVVMTGSASGAIRTQTLGEVNDIVEREGIGNLVRILGYVDDVTMAALYAGAVGVLLPTFFGPTNIPIIEGWAMGIPVLTSDIRGIREQCGDAAILVDPLSTEAITEGIRRLWTDDALREQLVIAGAERLHRSDPLAFRDELGRIITDAYAVHQPAEPQAVST